MRGIPLAQLFLAAAIVSCAGQLSFVSAASAPPGQPSAAPPPEEVAAQKPDQVDVAVVAVQGGREFRRGGSCEAPTGATLAPVDFSDPRRAAAFAKSLGGEECTLLVRRAALLGPGGDARLDGAFVGLGTELRLVFSARRAPSEPDSAWELEARLEALKNGSRLLSGHQLAAAGRTSAIIGSRALKDACLVVLMTPLNSAVAGADQAISDSSPAQNIAGPKAEAGAVQSPVAIKKVDPGYPEAARRDRRQGVVPLECTIDDTGAVDSAWVRGPSPDAEDFEQDALRTVMKWRYRPASLNGRPVRTSVTVVISYQLGI